MNRNLMQLSCLNHDVYDCFSYIVYLIIYIWSN